jgi:small subunit ribosomal protein S21
MSRLWVHSYPATGGRTACGFCIATNNTASKAAERVYMIKVKSRGNETAEQMLRRFKKMCEKEGLTKDIKRIAYYEKPSEKRRRRQRKPRIGGNM